MNRLVEEDYHDRFLEELDIIPTIFEIHKLVDPHDFQKMDKIPWYCPIDPPIEIFLARAEKGEAEAQHEVGRYFETQEPITDDAQKKAFFWYQKAAFQMYEPAIYSLAYCYAHGTGVEIDLIKACYVNQADVDCFEEKSGPYFATETPESIVPKVLVSNCVFKAILWAYKTVHISAISLARLAQAYVQGTVVAKNYSKAFELYQRLLQTEQAHIAHYRLWHLYRYGLGCQQNIPLAMEHLFLSNMQAFQDEVFTDTKLTLSSREEKRNLFYASDHPLQETAEPKFQGYPRRDICSIAQCYQQGLGVKRDEAKAFEIFRGQTALFRMGACYAAGRGVPQSYAHACEHFLKSGSVAGICYLMLYQREGMLCLSPSHRQLFEACVIRAKRGVLFKTHLEYWIACLYIHGIGIERSFDKAIALVEQIIHDYFEQGEGPPAIWRALRAAADPAYVDQQVTHMQALRFYKFLDRLRLRDPSQVEDPFAASVWM